jgi:hypothetical protein
MDKPPCSYVKARLHFAHITPTTAPAHLQILLKEAASTRTCCCWCWCMRPSLQAHPPPPPRHCHTSVALQMLRAECQKRPSQRHPRLQQDLLNCSTCPLGPGQGLKRPALLSPSFHFAQHHCSVSNTTLHYPPSPSTNTHRQQMPPLVHLLALNPPSSQGIPTSPAPGQDARHSGMAPTRPRCRHASSAYRCLHLPPQFFRSLRHHCYVLNTPAAPPPHHPTHTCSVRTCLPQSRPHPWVFQHPQAPGQAARHSGLALARPYQRRAQPA